MKVAVFITAADIQNQQRADSCDCAVARGLVRALGGESIEWAIYVSEDSFQLDFFSGRRPRIRLPAVARDAIAKLDRAEGQEPFSFEVTIPDQYTERLLCQI